MNTSNQNHVLLVVPCFNEANRLDIGAWLITVKSLSQVSWLFVDDGSSDRTFELLSQLALSENVGIHRLEKNSGKAEAIRQGMLNGLTDKRVNIVGFIDADRAFSDRDIEGMISFLEQNMSYNAVISSRVALLGREIIRTYHRHFLGRLLVTFIAFGFAAAPYDCQSGFKLFRVGLPLEKALQTSFSTRWFFDLELLIRIFDNTKMQYKIWEYPLMSWAEIPGSKINSRQAIRIVKEAVIVRNKVRSHIKRSARWT